MKTIQRHRRHRQPRADGGFVLLEAIVSIALITILMTALTALFVSTMKVTNHQRTNQSAVRLATDLIDNARGLGATNLPTTSYDQTIGNVTYTVKPSQEVCAIQPDGSCPAAADGTYVRYSVLITWPGSQCGTTPCKYTTSMVLSTASDPVFLPVGSVSVMPGPLFIKIADQTLVQATVNGNACNRGAGSIRAINLTDDPAVTITGYSSIENLSFAVAPIVAPTQNVLGIEFSATGSTITLTAPCKTIAQAPVTVTVTDSATNISRPTTFYVNVAPPL
jgi:type II secretory pathway pseudopilin PulG